MRLSRPSAVNGSAFVAEGWLFSVASRAYDACDVVIAAIVRGEWAPLEARVRQGLACLRHNQSLESAADVDVEEEAREFRYARNLLTVEEVEHWLSREGLAFDDWSAYLERSVLRRAFAHKLGEIMAESSSAIGRDEVRRLLHAEAVCSGELHRLTVALAARAALSARMEDQGAADDGEPGPDEFARAREACAEVLGPQGLAGLTLEGWAERVPEMVRLEAGFQACTKAARTEAAIRAEIDGRRAEWTRVDWRYLEVGGESIAREALLCLREDGASLAEVAARARVSAREETVFLESVEPTARSAVLVAQPGEILGPLAVPEGFRVVRITAKAPPSDGDPVVRRRAEEQVVANLIDRETKKRVRWHAAS